MRALFCVLAPLLATVATAALWDVENITALTTETFDEYLDAHPLVLVEFYLPVRDTW